MPTLRELLDNSNSYKYGTDYSAIKRFDNDKTTRFEREISGIRIKSAVEVNNPLIYGNEATRITLRSTPLLDKMKDAAGGQAGDGGLVGKALGAITGGGLGRALFGGKVTSLSQARDGLNSKLGIPMGAIPTYVQGHGGLQRGKEPDTMITLGKIRNDARGTEFGKFLKQTGGGNFRTIGGQAVGQGISLIKDKLRDVLLGKSREIGNRIVSGGTDSDSGFAYSSDQPYSLILRNVKNNEPTDNIQIQPAGKVEDLKSKASSILKKTKKVDDTSEPKDYTDEAPYSSTISDYRTNDSTSTNLTLPSDESNQETKQEVANELTSKKPIGEEQKVSEVSSDNPYSSTVLPLTEEDSTDTNLTIPSDETNQEVKQEVANKETDKKPLGEKQEVSEVSSDNPYSSTVLPFTEEDSTGTNLSVPSEESDTEKKQDTANKETDKKPLGEKQEVSEVSSDNTYSTTLQQKTTKDSTETTYDDYIPDVDAFGNEIRKDTNERENNKSSLDSSTVDSPIYDEKNTYSSFNLPSTEKNSTKTPTPPSDNTEIIKDTQEGLNKRKTLGDSISSNSTLESGRNYSEDTKYSRYTDTNITDDSTNTDLLTPSAESQEEIKRQTDLSLNKNNQLGETTSTTNYSQELKHSDVVRGEQIDETNSGEYSQIDLSILPQNSNTRTNRFFSTKKSNTSIYNVDNKYSSPTNGTKATLESKYGITTNSGDYLNSENSLSGNTEELEEKGLIPFWIQPINGKSIHFRASITGLTETVSPNWSAQKMFGNPFSFYTYDGIERNVAFNLQMFCYNPAELGVMWQKIQLITQQSYPEVKSVNGIKYNNPPIIKFRLGDIYNRKIGFIESLSYTVPDNGNWETDGNIGYLPKLVDVSITIKFIETTGTEDVLYNYQRTKDSIKLVNEKRGSNSESSVSGEPQTTVGTPTPAGVVLQPPQLPTVDTRGIEQLASTANENNTSGVNSNPQSLNGNNELQIEKGLDGNYISRTQSIAGEVRKKMKEKLDAAGIEEWAHDALIDRGNILNIKQVQLEDGTPAYYYSQASPFGEADMEWVMTKNGTITYEQYVGTSGKDPIGTKGSLSKQTNESRNKEIEKETNVKNEIKSQNEKRGEQKNEATKTELAKNEKITQDKITGRETKNKELFDDFQNTSNKAKQKFLDEQKQLQEEAKNTNKARGYSPYTKLDPFSESSAVSGVGRQA